LRRRDIACAIFPVQTSLSRPLARRMSQFEYILRWSLPGASPSSQTIVRTVNAAPGWTSIVPFDLSGDGLTDLLSYNVVSGLAFYSIANAAGEQQVVGPAVQGAAGWSVIVPMKLTPDPAGVTRGLTDLFFYR
jgi:hypothetical protein